MSAETAIRQVVDQYVAALEARSITALKRIWPSLGGAQEQAFRDEFANARSVQVRLSDPRIAVNGDSATVTATRQYSLVTSDGQRLATQTTTTLAVRRAGDDWVIERVAHRQ